uniref:TSA: Wollemia nobilis Ref_Wollemi_Transcript_6287_1253 transcribed RNA sequence n=1 Tax=Wollemia nobilis TaxID=56998 RepID=A0A0C9S831_9CONI
MESSSTEDVYKGGDVIENVKDSEIFAVAPDLVLGSRSFGSHASDVEEEEEEGRWDCHQCDSPFSYCDDFSYLEDLGVLKVEGRDKAGRRILRIVGKYFPAILISGQRLQKYICHKISNEIPEGPFCVVYIHTEVQRSDNCPGVSTLRWIYEELPLSFKDRLHVVYFLHPGLQARLLFATFGRFFLSGGLYWKLKYVNRLEFLWDHIRKGQIEIPDFVYDHDDQLEDRPLMDYGVEINEDRSLMDYGVEVNPFQVYDMPVLGSAYARHSYAWAP